MNSELPTGTLTHLFTDLEGSTQLWERYPEAMQPALARHYTILQEAVASHRGKIVKKTGDGLHAVFVSASDGILAAFCAQETITTEKWTETAPLRVRMAVHSGEAELRDGDYYGSTVNRAARLMDIGHGGQILLSQATATLGRDTLPTEVDLIDLGDHRLNDLTSAEHVYQVAHPKLPNHFPPLRSLASYSHNLPLQLNSFVGRDQEMETIKNYLDSTRLLTLFGPGGTGKTRLMQQTAAQVLYSYKGGVWLVELASLTDPDQLVARVASTFSLREQPNQTLLETLTDYLRYKQVLLLLDNCEHLVAASARLVEHLLQNCPKLSVMVTSREGLGIHGEVTYQVPSLTLPSREEDTLEEIYRSECAQLFSERAREVLPTFKLNAENARYVAQICRRLDGIPLAIELAAARINVLSTEQIANRLQDRFRLLTGGSRTALPRQQTLKALIDWSWDLLSESERHLLRHLSVFSGSWSLDAVEAIAGGHTGDSSTSEQLDVFENLTHLVAKSLVVAERGSQHGNRYRILESIRHYAHDRLVESGEATLLRDRHAEYYSQYFIDAGEHLRGPEMATWMKRLEIDYDNLRAAMEWSLETRPQMVLRSLSTLIFAGGGLTNPSESRRWLEQALDRARVEAASADQSSNTDILYQAKGNFLLATICFSQGEHAASKAAVEESISLARKIGATRELAEGLPILALSIAYLGDIDTAIKTSYEAITLSRQNGYRWELSMALSSYSVLHTYSGELELARSYTQEGLKIAQEIESPWLIGLHLRNAARVAALQGHVPEALSYFEQSVEMFKKQGNRSFVIVSQSDLGHFLRRKGDIQAARAIYEKTILEWFEHGNRPAVAHQLECFAYLASAQGNYQLATTLIGAAETLRESAHSLRMGEEQEEYEQEIKRLRDKLSEKEFQSSLNTGQGMSIEQAIDFALS
jgi:predicted ATPase/class 3 adenylate cyclase